MIIDRHIRIASKLDNERLGFLGECAKQCLHLDGDFIECGVYRGGSAYLLAQIMQGSKKELHLFDTFCGMPDFAKDDPAKEWPGCYGDTSLKGVVEYLSEYDFINFHPGVLPDMFAALSLAQKFAFAHVDLDLHQSTLDACKFVYPRMVVGGVMVFDDYGFPNYKNSAKKAVDEFFADKSENIILSETKQGWVKKL